MASIHRRSGSAYWAASYYREDGTRAFRSTKTTDRKEALRIANDLEAAHKRKLTEGQMRRILSDLNERLAGQPLTAVTLRQYAEQWLARKEGEIEKVSFDAYRGTVNAFIKTMPKKADIGIQYISVQDIAAYRDRSAAKATAKTANNKVKILRTFLQTAWRDGFIPENPAAKVDLLKTEDSTRRPFTLPEIGKILAVANIEWRGMVLFGLYTGQRLKDVATLRWQHIDAEKGVWTFSTSKTARRQEIPLAQSLLDYLGNLPATDDADAPVFPKACATVEKYGNVHTLSQKFYDILFAAGLVPERLSKDKSKGIGRTGKREKNALVFHSLRHTATSLLKNAGVSESIAQDIIGHDSAEMSKHYSHIDLAAKRKAIALLPNITTTTEGR
jgi:integrase